ncbi:MAG: hypothetical protein RI883_2078 [Bacteroidota bacterium]|jgi:hemoglobin
MKDIETRSDIEIMVNKFYAKIMIDKLLSPFFKNLNFEIHLPKMVDFWAFVLLDEVGYSTNVTEKHLKMALNKEHFAQWLKLFNETINQNWEGENAEKAKQRAYLIGWTIESKMSN